MGVVLGLDHGDRDVGPVIEDVVGPLALAPADQLAAHDETAFGGAVGLIVNVAAAWVLQARLPRRICVISSHPDRRRAGVMNLVQMSRSLRLVLSIPIRFSSLELYRTEHHHVDHLRQRKQTRLLMKATISSSTGPGSHTAVSLHDGHAPRSRRHHDEHFSTPMPIRPIMLVTPTTRDISTAPTAATRQCRTATIPTISSAITYTIPTKATATTTASWTRG